MASRRPTDSPRNSTATPATPAVPNTPVAESASPVNAPTVRKPRAKRPVASAKATTVAIEISEDVRRGMIAEAAYLRAERRGFTGGHEKERDDWIAAEAEVDALLKAGHGSSAQ
jgi:Protein of unknown function (DUF2934)